MLGQAGVQQILTVGQVVVLAVYVDAGHGAIAPRWAAGIVTAREVRVSLARTNARSSSLHKWDVRGGVHHSDSGTSPS